VDCFRRKTGASISRRWGGNGAAVSDKLWSGASSSESIWRALVRGEDVGVSDTRYVVAKMLSLSDSCGRSTDGFHSVLSWPFAFGAVLERPACARFFGVTSSWLGGESGEPWPGCGGVLDLTDAGGEVFPWASDCCDMGPTLVRPSRRRLSESVAGRVADAAGRAPGTVARMRSLGAAEAQRKASWGSLACEDRLVPTDQAACSGRGAVLAVEGGERVRVAVGPRSDNVWTGRKPRVLGDQAKE
jgi:hypothetical protein